MFVIIRGEGFQIEFANGIHVSVQFGNTNYCDAGFAAKSDRQRPSQWYESRNAEVAIFREEETPWLTKKCWRSVFKEKGVGDVVGWCSPDMVAKVIAWAARQK